MLGIGDGKILRDQGLRSFWIDLVSETIYDHFRSLYITETDSKYESVEVLKNPARAAEWKLYELSRRGILAGTASTTYAFLPENYFTENFDFSRAAALLSKPQLNIQKEWFMNDKVAFSEKTEEKSKSLPPNFQQEKGQVLFLGLEDYD
ncbi:hypothetical protein B0H19DRAFT_1085140 [Mycena capillaripes]|nr:hypothetical protein B0H19DRAFT_1085140 [Mycena capillaripes]